MKSKLVMAGFIVMILSACKESGQTSINKPDYLKAGDSIAAASFGNLRSALQQAIGEKGPAYAIQFCHDQANALTGRLASDSIQVFRVAEKYRNPANRLQDPDRAVWEQYLQARAKGDSLFSKVVETDSTAEFYKPILLLPMCTTCHGQPNQDIPASLARVIDSVYPGDLAKGFSPGDLRGMWHIRFLKGKP